MATEFSLELSTDLKPARALRLMADRLGLEWGDEEHLLGPALWVSAVEATPGWSTAEVEEAFHFRPTLSVGFRLDPNSDDYEESYHLLLRAVLLLLEHGRDAVLLFNGETIVLQRLAGQLVLNADYRVWKEGYRLEGEVHLPHEVRSLPPPWR